MPRLKRLKSGEGVDLVTCQICRRDYKVIAGSHLAFIHGWDSEHPVYEYQRKFQGKRTQCLRTQRKRKDSLHERLERVGRRWTRKRLRSLIRDRMRRSLPVNEGALRNLYSGGRDAAMRLFGNWDNLLRYCGLSPAGIRLRVRWSKSKIVEELRAFRNRGVDVSSKAIYERRGRLLAAAQRLYGSWDAALQAAGFDPLEIRKTRFWNRALVLATIRQLARELGKRKGDILRGEELETLDSGVQYGARRSFGSVKAAVLAAGFTQPDWHRRAKKWSAQAILQEIRSRARRGVSIRAGEIRRSLSGMEEAARRQFSSWRAAVERAGLGDRLPPMRRT